MTTLFGIAITALPFLAVIALLKLMDWRQARRASVIGRQVALTDAIHRELGAAAAPVVSRRRGDRWIVTMEAPLDRPGTTAALVRVTEGAFADAARTGRLRIVLAPERARPTRATARPASGRRLDPHPVAVPAAR